MNTKRECRNAEKKYHNFFSILQAIKYKLHVRHLQFLRKIQQSLKKIIENHTFHQRISALIEFTGWKHGIMGKQAFDRSNSITRNGLSQTYFFSPSFNLSRLTLFKSKMSKTNFG